MAPRIEDMNRTAVHKAPEFEERSFWDKVAEAAGDAGREVIEIALTLYYALIDDDTPLWAKSTIIGGLLYFISPIDAIPDFIPGIGFTDDLAVMVGALGVVAAHIKPEHKERAREWVEINL